MLFFQIDFFVCSLVTLKPFFCFPTVENLFNSFLMCALLMLDAELRIKEDSRLAFRILIGRDCPLLGNM